MEARFDSLGRLGCSGIPVSGFDSHHLLHFMAEWRNGNVMKIPHCWCGTYRWNVNWGAGSSPASVTEYDNKGNTMKNGIEYRPNGNKILVGGEKSRSYIVYIKQSDGTYVMSRNGPWDWLGNARKYADAQAVNPAAV